MTGTTISQGRFTSFGADVIINVPQGCDWFKTYNVTVAADAGVVAKQGVEFYWQRGIPPENAGIVFFKGDAANAGNAIQLVDDIFFPFDSSLVRNGAIEDIAAISGANPPVVTSNGSNLVVGNVVRIFDVAGAAQLGGIDFTVGNGTLTANTFSLDYMTPIAVGGAGEFRVVSAFGSPTLYQPSTRYITSITNAALAVVRLSVTHNYAIGQEVRFVVPEAYGMTEINGLVGTIVAVDYTAAPGGNDITVDIDTTAFTPFDFPLDAAVPFSPALVIPFGENTATALAFNANILGDSVVNIGIIGMKLKGGDHDSPAGEDGDVIMWVAGKSFSVTNL